MSWILPPDIYPEYPKSWSEVYNEYKRSLEIEKELTLEEYKAALPEWLERNKDKMKE